MTTPPRTTREQDPVERARAQWAQRYPDESGFVVVVSMLRTYALMIRELERILKPVGLTLTRFEVLLLLSFSAERRLPTMRLRDLLLIHGSSATYLVDRLELRGWVRREAEPADRRVNYVVLTDEGETLVERAVEALVAAGWGHAAGLDAAERRQITALLAALRGAESPALV